MLNHTKPEVTIVGPGAVGGALVKALVNTGIPVRSIVTRSPQRQSIFPAIPKQLASELKRETTGNLFFLAVPDDQIAPLAKRLAGQYPALFRGRSVVHCSGFLNSDELKPLEKVGATTASFHPIQTFTKGASATRLAGITISLEGDPVLVSRLEGLVQRLGSTPLPLDQEQKSVIHVSAVFLSNYLVALGGLANRLIGEAIPNAPDGILRPLLLQTASNLASHAPEEILTGPVSRGDVNTIDSHLKLLSEKTNEKRLYCILGLEAVRLAERRGELDSGVIEQMKAALLNSH